MSTNTELIADLQSNIVGDPFPLMRKAADAIEKLQTEVDRLTTLAHGQHIELYNARLQLAAAQTEVERLKEVVNLQVENYAELKEQNEAQHGYFNSVMQERDALQAEVERLKSLAGGYANENLRLQAQLAAAQGQEPVIWRHLYKDKEIVYYPYRNTGSFYTEITPLYLAAPIPQQPAPGVPEDWKQAVALAYGHLWHVNNEPMAPIPLRSSETAAYEARKQLRDLLTHEERGLAINQVQAMLAAAPQPKEQK